MPCLGSGPAAIRWVPADWWMNHVELALEEPVIALTKMWATLLRVEYAATVAVVMILRLGTTNGCVH